MELAVVVGAVAALATVALTAWTTVRSQSRAESLERRLAIESSLTDPTLSRLAPDEHDEELVRRIARHLDADLASYLTVEGPHLVLRAISGPAVGAVPLLVGAELPVDAGLAGRVVTDAEPVLLGDVDPSEVGVAAVRGRVRSFLGCPVLSRGELVGVVAIGSEARSAFTAADVQVVRRAADRFGWSFEERLVLADEDVVATAQAEAEHRVRTLFEVAPVGIVELSTTGEVARWNGSAADLLAWPRWLEGVAPATELPDVARQAVAHAALGQRTDRVPMTVERAGARPADVVASASPLTDREGTVEGVVLLLDDVTERQALEQHVRQAQRLDALARLAGGVAHDFNNLLTVIRGYGEVLLRTAAPGDQAREDIEAILEAAQRASQLTKQLLAIGRRPAAEPGILDVHREVAELEPVLVRLAGDGVALRVVLDATVAAPVLIDRGDLAQSVMNLVINARDAMPDGGSLVVESRTIELRSRSAALAGVAAGRYAMVTVADTGTGMPPEVLEHCFDPFFTTKQLGRGSGIGLATVYGVVTQVGGHVTVESTVGRGTTFRLWFPVTSASASVSASPSGSEEARAARPVRRTGGRTGRTPRVLLVEDEAMVRTLARATLEDAGYAVVDVESAEDALAKVGSGAEEPFDVLVSDVVLGGMRGDELAVRLRKADPALHVVLMSGFTTTALAMQPDAFLAKPFAFSDVVAAVAGLVPVQAGAPASRATARSGNRRRAR